MDTSSVINQPADPAKGAALKPTDSGRRSNCRNSSDLYAEPISRCGGASSETYSARSLLGEEFDGLMAVYPVLSPAEERKMLRSKRSDEGKRDLLWKHNLRIAVLLANEAFSRRHHSCIITPREMACAAVKTLWDASQKFDWSKGVLFAGYARWVVKRELSNTLRKSASGVTLPPKFLAKLSSNRTLFGGVESFDAPKGPDNTTDLHGMVADDTRRDPEDTDALEDMLARLERQNSNQVLMLRAYFGLGTERLSGVALAKKLGTSKQAVDQTIKKGLRRLREIAASKGHKLNDFI